MSKKLELVAAADTFAAETSHDTERAPTVAMEAPIAPRPAAEASATTVVRRRARKDLAELDAAENEASATDDEMAEVAADQVPPVAPAGQAVASGAAAAGGQVAATSSIGGLLSGVGLAANPMLIAAAVAGTVGVAAAASGGGGEESPPANRAPAAVTDVAAATEDAGVVTGSIATNDSDPENDALTYRLLSETPGLVFNADGSFTFDPWRPGGEAITLGDHEEAFKLPDGIVVLDLIDPLFAYTHAVVA